MSGILLYAPEIHRLMTELEVLQSPECQKQTHGDARELDIEAVWKLDCT
jgi:hypothetical protein